MPKSATDLMQDILFAAVVDSLDALKRASKGVPNTLLRDIGAIHANSTFSDLPKELQEAILSNVRSAFNRLNKEGYSVGPLNAPPPRPRPAPTVAGADDRRRRPPRGNAPPRGPRKPGGGPGKPR